MPRPTEVQPRHFDGQRFYNQAPFQERGFLDFLKWKLFSGGTQWPVWIESEPQLVPEQRVSGDRLSVTFVNHSTVLIQYQGINILTDPIWNHRASPLTILGPKRVRRPGLRLDDLPPIDLVLITHNHYDHLDIETIKLLAERGSPIVVTGRGNTPVLQEAGLETIQELDWWESFQYQALNIVFTPTQHFSGRGLFDKRKSLWGGFVIASPAGNVYFSGDTGVGPHHAQLRARFKEFRVAFLPIGAYEPRWFMKAAHMNPAEAVEAHQLLNANVSIGIHFGTFANLTDEGIEQPLKDLAEALTNIGVDPRRFVTLGFGETRDDL
ncbi:MAG: MBL fold metallo-hydrolase [Nitrospira sp.]|nr:MBL fold metallo-hydrolase [Nitrospira sp.]MDH5194571.1 MBL fold metallo-hydrolase [Nitrospira sp.]